MTTRAGAATGAVVVAALMLAGCAPEPSPSPTISSPSPSVSSPSPTPSSDPSPGIPPTPSDSPSPTSSPVGPPATRPVEPPTGTDPDAAAMTSAQAGTLCAAEHRTGQSAGDTQIGKPTVYERSVSPRWYVTILAENEFGQYYQECILGGSEANPEWSLTQGTPKDQLTAAHIEQMRTQNEDIDEDH
ncbi:hypothetical protein ACIQLK_13290 [Microbacterium sp. NPDC091382]|uniref:hypothetical protein n=1 Tax=Microbacterium sp. NPDC091382 TaxID=3364210 RepID=UPI0038025EE4